MDKRFRVALSFPRRYMATVERVAEAVAARVGREKVLHYPWYGPEFARPALSVYLPELYHNDAELLVFFLGREYQASEWCGLEWSAALDLIKRGEPGRVMLLQMEDGVQMPGLYTTAGFLDVRGMSADGVGAAILQRLGASAGVVPRSAVRTSVQKLPRMHLTLFGREAEIEWLERAWTDDVNFAQIIAPGGTGKTALMTKWYRTHLEDVTIFGWSFYSQGTQERSQTSSDPFFAEALKWFRVPVATTESLFTKVDALVERLRLEKVLLILDGIEPLQDASGAVKDLALRALLEELAARNAGMLLCTTRVRLSDVGDEEGRARSLELENLTAVDGSRYLRHLRVQGSDEELREASEAYGNHALALTLLGTYLATFCDADVRRRSDIRELEIEETKAGRHARKVMASYAQMYEGQPELEILKGLGYFDRPAEVAALRLVMAPVGDRAYRAALGRLQDARLVLRERGAMVDCHPLVREHFATYATAEGHVKLYEHYKGKAKKLPDTLEEMTPLFWAVFHGSKAGRHQEVCDEIYRDRILRGAEAYLFRRLGASGTALALLAHFFDKPWTGPVGTLEAPAQAWLISMAGFSLRALGRLHDAVGPMGAGADAAVRLGDWENASVYHGNVSELHLVLGNLEEAVRVARQAIAFADRSGKVFERVRERTTLADALHQCGNLSEATQLFQEAEDLQAKSSPGAAILDSMGGYRYCSLLLGLGQISEVSRRVSETLRNGERHYGLLDLALEHITLACTQLAGSVARDRNLDEAVELLRRAGTLHHLPRALLARGTHRDLEEVYRIATRCGMRLHLCDYHLAMAKRTGERKHVAEAERLIEETGYHRRDSELAALKRDLDGAAAGA